MVWFFQFFSDLNDFSIFFSLLLRAIQVAHEGLYGGQSPNSTVCIVLFPEVWGMLTEKVWLGCSGCFFFLLLFPRKIRLNFQNNCVLQFVILSIIVLLLLIIIYLAFDVF